MKKHFEFTSFCLVRLLVHPCLMYLIMSVRVAPLRLILLISPMALLIMATEAEDAVAFWGPVDLGATISETRDPKIV